MVVSAAWSWKHVHNMQRFARGMLRVKVLEVNIVG